jgi:flagellar basal-body rod protein FlgB
VPQSAAVARPGDLPLGGAAPSSAAERFVVADEGTPAGLDGNQVDLDRTTAAIAENALQYGAAARAAGKKLAILRYAASDGQA